MILHREKDQWKSLRPDFTFYKNDKFSSVYGYFTIRQTDFIRIVSRKDRYGDGVQAKRGNCKR